MEPIWWVVIILIVLGGAGGVLYALSRGRK